MKKLIVLFTLATVFISCKENIVAGYTSVSVKQDVVNTLDKSEWVANSSEAYYSKLVFDKEIIEGTIRNGAPERMGFHVSNITSPTMVLPDTIQLRLKSGLYLNEIYLSNNYTSLQSVVRKDAASTFTSESHYTRIK